VLQAQLMCGLFRRACVALQASLLPFASHRCPGLPAAAEQEQRRRRERNCSTTNRRGAHLRFAHADAACSRLKQLQKRSKTRNVVERGSSRKSSHGVLQQSEHHRRWRCRTAQQRRVQSRADDSRDSLSSNHSGGGSHSPFPYNQHNNNGRSSSSLSLSGAGSPRDHQQQQLVLRGS
jgi:hypothetical protein